MGGRRESGLPGSGFDEEEVAEKDREGAGADLGRVVSGENSSTECEQKVLNWHTKAREGDVMGRK